MNHQNLLLQDDPFAVPDSIEHLPSFHVEPIAQADSRCEHGRYPGNPCLPCGAESTSLSSPAVAAGLLRMVDDLVCAWVDDGDDAGEASSARIKARKELESAMCGRIESLERQLAEAIQDAARYQWLITYDNAAGWDNEIIDQQIAVDAALKERA